MRRLRRKEKETYYCIKHNPQLYKSIKGISMKALLSFLFLAFSVLAFGQLNLSGVDKQSFLIGTLDDYMGHQQTVTATTDSSYYQLVDIYTQNQKDLALLIDSLFRTEYKDIRMTNNGAPKGIRLYSKGLSTKINNYYNYLPSGTYTSYHDTIYTGHLKPENISTKLEKLSFLAGAFLRDGGKTDADEYFFTIPNSTSKAKMCLYLLNEFKCLEVNYKRLNRIPVGNWITFKPSEEVLNMLRKVETLKKEKPFPSAALTHIMTKMS